MSPVVVDTNVGVVANGVAVQASNDCRLTAVRALHAITRDGGLVIDSSGLIFAEYCARLRLSGRPGVGDLFARWVHDHQWDATQCERVNITPDPERVESFLEFPRGDDLAGFHDSDRKFVAVAVAHGGAPPILQAVDAGWWQFRDALEANGVVVDFICADIELFRRAADG